MRLVRAGVISDAELLRLREQPLSWCAVLDRMHERRTDEAVRELELLARHHTPSPDTRGQQFFLLAT